MLAARPAQRRVPRRISRSRQEEITAMDTFPDLGSLSDQELKDLIQQLTEEEIDISYKRRILHGKIDILRAELVNRLRKKHETGEDVITGADVQRLTDILAGRAVTDGDEGGDGE
jgi:RsiG-like